MGIVFTFKNQIVGNMTMSYILQISNLGHDSLHYELYKKKYIYTTMQDRIRDDNKNMML